MMEEPNSPTRWLARHERVIVLLCLAVVALLVVWGVLTWIKEGWWQGLGLILSSAGYLALTWAAREARRRVAAYDARD